METLVADDMGGSGSVFLAANMGNPHQGCKVEVVRVNIIFAGGNFRKKRVTG